MGSEDVNWIHLVQDMVRWWDLVMNIRVPLKSG
jgi:hypothetical protein